MIVQLSLTWTAGWLGGWEAGGLGAWGAGGLDGWGVGWLGGWVEAITFIHVCIEFYQLEDLQLV